MPKQKYQTPEVLHDAPLTGAKPADFHFDDFAATFARLIASPNTETPLAIGINGAWGSGKTSLLLRVKDMLDNPLDEKGVHRFAEDEEKTFRVCKTVWFNAWKYANEEELSLSILRITVQSMYASDYITRIAINLLDPYKKRQSAINRLLSWFSVKTPIGDVKINVAQPESIPLADSMSGLERLMAPWLHRRLFSRRINPRKAALVLFIDDLDRCLPEKVVQILEAIQLYLDLPGCVFIIGADIRIVQAAIETHYKDVKIVGESAKDFLEKIIQLRFDLPPIFESAMENYLKTQDKTKVDDAMLKRWQALVAAAEVNPRRVKNVINDLNLQWYMAINSGQAEGVNRDDFICWQALLRAAPAKFVGQVTKFEDKAIRHNFVMDLLKWQLGKQEDKDAVKGFFSDYEDDDSRRLRRVLKQISFSDEFTPDALDSMIYMTAPSSKSEPMKPLVEEQKAEAEIQPEGIKLEAVGEVKEAVAMRGEKIAPRGDSNEIEIGGLRFVRVPKGRFVMGSKDDNELAYDQEKPQHTVDINYDYWMAKFILTNEQYAEFLGKRKHPVSDWQKKKDHPVVSVSWNDAMEYCKWFNDTFKYHLGDLLLRLPTEAEWEKAARGAYRNEWPWGNEFNPNKCNSAEGRKGGTKPVGAYSTVGGDSPYGCADMIGNVWEWCNDWFSDSEYKGRTSAPVLNPKGPQQGSSRVLRGGSFYNARNYARCASRSNNDPGYRLNDIGFRVCVVPHQYI